MSCEVEPRTTAARPDRRRPAGWLLLLLIAGLAAFYGDVLWRAVHPRVDEAYRRTFLTAEFGVFPASNDFAQDGGLAYAIGTTVDFRDPSQRRFLSRFDWEHNEQPIVTLRGVAGRLFLHATGEVEIGQKPHRLTLVLRCQIPLAEAGDIDVGVNGRTIGTADCGKGTVTVDAALPAGAIGLLTFDRIEVRRAAGSLYERLLTRLGIRARAIELVSFAITPA